MKSLNILSFILRSSFGSRSRLRVITSKIGSRVFEHGPSADYVNWLSTHAKDLEEFCRALEPNLWLEAERNAKEIEESGKIISNEVPFKMGGAGACSFLYFLARYTKPETIVETGVALGFSSATFLKAIERNDLGTLESSDFPYPGIPNSEQFVGIVVPKTLKDKTGWEPYLDGDENNLPKIVKKIVSVDLLHYDSDKSYRGRVRALSILEPKMNEHSIIVFDDIHENEHFRDYSATRTSSEVHVFRFRNKYIGVIGNIVSLK